MPLSCQKFAYCEGLLESPLIGQQYRARVRDRKVLGVKGEQQQCHP